jgi:enoyl-CoA hydratase/carnithine racemase
MPLLDIELSDNLLTLTLNDPQTNNALSPSMAEELIQSLKGHDFEALCLKAHGSQFCSGGNLQFYKNLKSRDEGLVYNQRIAEILKALYEWPVPTFVYVQGGCFGGGIELITCFDWIMASPSSLFGLWQRRIGLTYGWGGQKCLEDRIGTAQAQVWLHGGETRSAWRAQEMGLVDEVLMRSQADQKIKQRVKRLKAMDPETFSEVKSHRKNQHQAFQSLWGGPRHSKALEKF